MSHWSLIAAFAAALIIRLGAHSFLKRASTRGRPTRVVAFVALSAPVPLLCLGAFSMLPALVEVCTAFPTSTGGAATFLLLLLAISGLAFALLAPLYRNLAMHRLTPRATGAGLRVRETMAHEPAPKDENRDGR